MSTKAQIKANQQNAQKSTGPKTEEGKAAVSQNAIRHGLFAAEAVIQGENPADYELYHDQFLAELVPVGMVEALLAGRIVSLAWRLQRTERMHNEAIDVMLAQVETNGWQKNLREDAIKAQDPRAGGLELLLGWATKYDFSNSRVLERLLIYERRIENSLHKTIHNLKKYQLMRVIQEADARKQQHAQAIPKRGTGFQPVEHMAKMAMPLDQAIPEAFGFDAVTRHPPAEKECDLKKQTQFAQAIIGVKSFMKGDYGNNQACGIEENKPKQTQLEPVKAGFKIPPAPEGDPSIHCSSKIQR